jgi:hypothetical protein
MAKDVKNKRLGKLARVAAEVLPSGMPGFLLAPGGLLLERRGSGEVKDLTSEGTSYLFETVRAHPGFTVRDLFLFLERNRQTMVPVYGRERLDEWLAHFADLNSGAVVSLPGPVTDDRHILTSVELQWRLYGEQGETQEDRQVREKIESGKQVKKGPRRRILDADGESLDELMEEWAREKEQTIRLQLAAGTYWERVKSGRYINGTGYPTCIVFWKNKKNDRKSQPSSMSFIPLKDLLGARLALGTTMEIHIGDKAGRRGGMFKYANPSFTLGQVIQGFLWELSFHGGPGAKAAVAREVEEAIEKTKLWSDKVKK